MALHDVIWGITVVTCARSLSVAALSGTTPTTCGPRETFVSESEGGPACICKDVYVGTTWSHKFKRWMGNCTGLALNWTSNSNMYKYIYNIYTYISLEIGQAFGRSSLTSASCFCTAVHYVMITESECEEKLPSLTCQQLNKEMLPDYEYGKLGITPDRMPIGYCDLGTL